MDAWFLVTQIGLAEAWAAISLGMVITYLAMRYTVWKEPSGHRKAFKAATVVLTLTLIITFVSVRAIKVSARVPRPCTPCSIGNEGECNPYCVDDLSFPSGHAATIFAVCTAAFLLLRRRKGVFLYVPAALVAYSRIALGVHTPADVLAGAAIGMLSAVLVWKMRPRLRILS